MQKIKAVDDSENAQFWEGMQEFISYLDANGLEDYKKLLYKTLQDNVKLYTKLEELGYDFDSGTNTENKNTIN